MKPEDAILAKSIMSELTRRRLNTSGVIITASNGIVRIQGTIRRIRGDNRDLNYELERARDIIKRKPGVRDVVINVKIR
ncbi:hypothetical protein H5T87_04370 [bacterium]|nr:hypothetical protein [bacterium]